MNTVNREFIEFAEKEITSIISAIEERKAIQIAKEIVDLIDWNDSALMHKGFSWMAKNYLMQRNMI